MSFCFRKIIRYKALHDQHKALYECTLYSLQRLKKEWKWHDARPALSSEAHACYHISANCGSDGHDRKMVAEEEDWEEYMMVVEREGWEEYTMVAEQMREVHKLLA